MENKYTRCDDPASPKRCTANGMKGQCPYEKMEGKDHCPRHATTAAGESPLERLVGGNYKLKATFAGRINELTSSEKIKSLREEISVLRMTLETLINRCEDQYDLVLQTDNISRLVDQINKLVVSCHKIEESSGQLLDKTVVINIGQVVVDILAQHVPDKSILDKVGARIYEAIATSASGIDA